MSEPMNIHQEYQPSIELEKKLESFYAAITPDPAFVSKLDLLVARQSKQLPAGHPGVFAWLSDSFRRRPVLAFSITVLLALALAITLAGPRQVLASVQRLLGFVPGSGFVQPGQTRILPAPVEARQGDITLRVEKVIAGPKQTEISLTASGLPREKFAPQTGEQDLQFLPYLQLSDGTRIRSNMSMSSIGDTLQASYIFDPLPDGVTQFTLVLPRLPGVPANYAPQDWSVPIQLVTVQVSPTRSSSDLLVPTGYAPANDLAQAKGVSVHLEQVGLTTQETGLQIQFSWNNPEWLQLNDVDLSLTDQDGHAYPQLRNPMELSGVPEALRTYRFQPFEPGASHATLTVDELHFTFKSPASFTLNPGKQFLAGQGVDVSSQPGSSMVIAGVPVKVLSTRLSQAVDDGVEPQPVHYHLEVLLQSTPTDGLALENVTMSIDPELLVSSSTQILPENQVKVTIDLPGLPKLPLTLYFSHGEVSLTGSWVIQWDLPGQ